ncbi:MAG: hypothetical protein K0U37_03505 [Gammaproteobacteria bacterium]|nr:hypothetical protein [Gammaproteobacteria bacterium]
MRIHITARGTFHSKTDFLYEYACEIVDERYINPENHYTLPNVTSEAQTVELHHLVNVDVSENSESTYLATLERNLNLKFSQSIPNKKNIPSLHQIVLEQTAETTHDPDEIAAIRKEIYAYFKQEFGRPPQPKLPLQITAQPITYPSLMMTHIKADTFLCTVLRPARILMQAQDQTLSPQTIALSLFERNQSAQRKAAIECMRNLEDCLFYLISPEDALDNQFLTSEEYIALCHNITASLDTLLRSPDCPQNTPMTEFINTIRHLSEQLGQACERELYKEKIAETRAETTLTI